jgi:hypothetical protein
MSRLLTWAFDTPSMALGSMTELPEANCRRRLAVRAALLLLPGVLLAGCGGPRAPALLDSPVYENSREGLKFAVPDGWTQSARGEMPKGRIEQERPLVEYQLLNGEKPSMFMVTRVDLPESEDLAAYMVKRQPSKENWRQVGTSEKLEINGAAATRFVFMQTAGADETAREIVVFRRGERCYLFAGTFSANDSKTRSQLRQSLQNVSWMN